MAASRNVIGLVGSPNPDGRTNQLVSAALEGAAQAGAATELIQMSDHQVAACRDCLPWVCKDNLKCTFDDDAFEFYSRKITDCGALILGTPVYWWDTSGLVKYLILKMFRVYAMSAPFHGLPACGIAIAGGTGNGLVSGLRPVYHYFQMMGMRAIEPLPATRFNFSAALQRASELGAEIAKMAGQRARFQGLEDKLSWYDALPYLGLSRADERRLLADLAVQGLPPDEAQPIALGLVRAHELDAAGRKLDALVEITRAYNAAVKAFEAGNSGK
jgi:multimeric flavodoxin WrbA